MQFDSLLGAIKTGKIDLIISGMTPTPERKKEVDFSDPYMSVTQKMIIKKSEAKIHFFLSLRCWCHPRNN